MSPSRRVLCVAALPLACGARSEIAGNANPVDAGSGDAAIDGPAPKPSCVGMPPVPLATNLTSSSGQLIFNGIATDGERVFVSQSAAPLVWTVSVLGGERLSLFGADVTVPPSTAIPPTPLLPANGGLFFNAVVEPPQSLSWVPSGGGDIKKLALVGVTEFDAAGKRGFTWRLSQGTYQLQSVALDGTLAPLLTSTGDVRDMLVTNGFIHVIVATSPTQIVDRRFDWSTHALHDEVPLPNAIDTVAGPTAICTTVENTFVACVQDDESTAGFFAQTTVSDLALVKYVDATWVYIVRSSMLTRFALKSPNTMQVLMEGVFTYAVASYGDCIYAAVDAFDDGSNVSVWRVSSP